MTFQFLVERNPALILEFDAQIRAEADQEREALGFLPAPAYREHILQKKLILLLAIEQGQRTYAGHILFGGAFPNARVYQTCVSRKFRRKGAGTILIRALVSQLERDGFLSICASVASDLTAANGFYERNGFAAAKTKAGGQTRGRSIIVRSRPLDTPSLFREAGGRGGARLPIKVESSAGAPVYAIDLNVLFDLVRNRSRGEEAGALFEAALAHHIRVVVAQEFVIELERTSSNPNNDPLLSLARRLPQLPQADKRRLDQIASKIEEVVFSADRRNTGLGNNDKSDARHIAHAAATGCSGYVTSDEAILRARNSIFSNFRIDVLGLTEFANTIGQPGVVPITAAQATENFQIESVASNEALITRLSAWGISRQKWHEWFGDTQPRCLAVKDDTGLVGASALQLPFAPFEAARLCVALEEQHPFSSTIADYLIGEACRTASTRSPAKLCLLNISTAELVRKVAIIHGFQSGEDAAHTLVKVAIGRAVTSGTWEKTFRQVGRLTGIAFPSAPPKPEDHPRITVAQPKPSDSLDFSLSDLETLLSPTLLAVPGRTGTIVPITRQYSRDLIGAEDQLSFLQLLEAGLLAQRTYLNSPRAASRMPPDNIIVFYESARTGGRGAIAAARITGSLVTLKNRIPEKLQRGAVVDDAQDLSADDYVLATTFDNLIPFKRFISFEDLRGIGCAGRQTFQTATRISSEHLMKIFDRAWHE